jgi:methyl-accepting chemotaxis protein
MSEPAQDMRPARRLFDLAVPMGLALADSSADLTEAARHLAEQTRMLRSVEASAEAMARSSAGMEERTAAISGTAASVNRRATEATRGTIASIAVAGACATRLASTASSVDRCAGAAEGQGESLRRSSDGIQKIAREIQMLAVNAGVEAARHGAAGRGFAVIAEAIKRLADQTRLATDEMGRNLAELAATITMLQGDCRENLDHARSMEGATAEAARQSVELDAAQAAAAEASAQLAQAVAATGQLARVSKDIGTGMRAGVGQLDRASERIGASTNGIADIQQLAESIVSHLIELDADLPIADLVGLCRVAARETGDIFEAALKAGEIGGDDLFDEQYRPIEGIAPRQYLTRFTALTDRLLPDLQERVLAADRRIVFCAAVDRNGYLPTHNRRFSQPPSSDPVWNAEHARNRRIFNDRSGLASARNRKAALLQSYRRDMGGGRFEAMSELASPILVNGRHWGAFRLGFRDADARRVA